jgi:hypothetical protein
MPPLVLRSAAVRDVDQVAGLLAQLGYDVSSEHVGARLRDFERSRCDHVVLAIVDAEIVGLIAVSTTLLLVEGAMARITALVVG